MFKIPFHVLLAVCDRVVESLCHSASRTHSPSLVKATSSSLLTALPLLITLLSLELTVHFHFRFDRQELSCQASPSSAYKRRQPVFSLQPTPLKRDLQT